MEIKKIETYSLYEFCQAVQQSIIEGWRFDFESNELFPTAFGSMLVTGMVKTGDKLPDQPKVETVIETDNTAEVEQLVDDLVDEFADKLHDIIEDKAENKRGRKPKDNT